MLSEQKTFLKENANKIDTAVPKYPQNNKTSVLFLSRNLYYIERTSQTDVVMRSRPDGSHHQVVLKGDANSDFLSLAYDNGKTYVLALNTLTNKSFIISILGSKKPQWNSRILEIKGVDYSLRSLTVHDGRAYITWADVVTILDMASEGATPEVLSSVKVAGEPHAAVAVSTGGFANSEGELIRYKLCIGIDLIVLIIIMYRYEKKYYAMSPMPSGNFALSVICLKAYHYN